MVETFLGIFGAAFLGIFGWVFQLGNRVTKIETRQDGLPALIAVQFEAVNQRLDRIERAMNGTFGGH